MAETSNLSKINDELIAESLTARNFFYSEEWNKFRKDNPISTPNVSVSLDIMLPTDAHVFQFAEAYKARAALRESASLHNPSESETKAAKLKLYDLWCQAGSEDFTQWLAEKAIELFAGARLTHTGGNNEN